MSQYGIIDAHIMGEEDYLRGYGIDDYPEDMTDLEVDNYQNAWAQAKIRDPDQNTSW